MSCVVVAVFQLPHQVQSDGQLAQAPFFGSEKRARSPVLPEKPSECAVRKTTGRFLAQKGDSPQDRGSFEVWGNIWFDVGEKKATKKTSHCLRELSHDVSPFVRKMQKQQGFLTFAKDCGSNL